MLSHFKISFNKSRMFREMTSDLYVAGTDYFGGGNC